MGEVANSTVGAFDISFRFRWDPVLGNADSPYRFPEPVSPLIRQRYARPAVYRWVPFRTSPDNFRQLYIGEAELLDRRISQYLNPGPSQRTNIRMKEMFTGFLAQGLQVGIEVLSFEPLCLGAIKIGPVDLADKLVRRFLEHMMAAYYRKSGFEVLNA